MGDYNPGILEKDAYVKHISFSKAVLWKDKQLSLRPNIIKAIQNAGVPIMRFVDKKKKEEWVFTVADVVREMERKIVGQEEQCYFPISLAQIKKLQ